MTRKDRQNSGWTRVVILAAILLSSLLVSINRSAVQKSSPIAIAAQESVTPLAAALSRPLRAIEAFGTSLSDRKNAFSENKALRKELAMMRERQVRYENLAMKVARYEAILGVDTETDAPLKKLAARAVGETDGPFVRSLLINIGTTDGVRIGNPVMSADGLVGHVINAGPGSARVLRLSDLNSRIAVASSQSGARAILAGDNTLRPKLAFMSELQDWSMGDDVISSGDDGALPRGLLVGQVVRDESGELRVELASRKTAIDWVWVSPFSPIVAPSDDPDAEFLATPAQSGETGAAGQP